jgi:phosphohistidine phosphatase
MMEIYLMQHGHSLPKDQDPEQGLSADGEAAVRLTARALKVFHVEFDAILSSPKKRSKQTAAIMAEETGFPTENITETEKVKPMTPAEETVRALADISGAERLLVAGHLPSVAEVASYLLTEGCKAAIEFEMGGCCCIEVDKLPTHSGRLRWFIKPTQLEMLM